MTIDTLTSSIVDPLCSVSLVSMVKATDLWNLNDPFRLVRLNGSTSWCVLIQGQVRAGFVIVAEIIFEQSTQMVFIEDDQESLKINPAISIHSAVESLE